MIGALTAEFEEILLPVKAIELPVTAVEEQASEESVKQLIISDQQLYKDLAQANNLIQSFLAKKEAEWHPPLLAPQDLPEFIEYNNIVGEIQQKLMNRQAILKSTLDEEKPDYFGLDTLTDFTESVKNNLIKYFNFGIGWFGLGAVIIVVLAIIAAALVALSITAAVITDMLTNSAQEDIDLLEATAKFMAETGLTKEEALQFMKDTMPKKAGITLFGGGGWIFALLIIGGIGLYYGTRK